MVMTAVEPEERCVVDGCSGVRAPALDVCFVHADEAGFKQAFATAFSGGDVNLDLRGTPLNQAAVDRILAACPTDFEGRKLLEEVDVRGARLTESLELVDASFGRLRRMT